MSEKVVAFVFYQNTREQEVAWLMHLQSSLPHILKKQGGELTSTLILLKD